MRIGIGVTTFKRPECLNVFLTQLDLHPPFHDYKLHIAQDIPNISWAKNACLKHLKDCDYIFLFDDDCVVKKKHWDLPFIESGHENLLYMNKGHGPAQELDDITRYKDCSGCFIFLTKNLFNTVGYFNHKYSKYGYEHLAYCIRIRKVTKDWAFLCLNKSSEYIHSFDLDGIRGWKVHHEPTVKREEINLCVVKNQVIFEEEINSDKIYYDYK